MKKILIYLQVFFVLSSSYSYALSSAQSIPYIIENIASAGARYVGKAGNVIFINFSRNAAFGAVTEFVPVAVSAGTTARLIGCVAFAGELATWALLLSAVGLVFKDGGFFTAGETPQSNFRSDGSYGSDVTIISKTSPSLTDCKMRFFRDYDSARAYMLANYNTFSGLSNLNGIKYSDINNNLVCCAPEFQAPFIINCLHINYSAPNKFIAAYPAQPQDISTWNAHYSYFNPAVTTSVPVTKDQVIEKIKEDIEAHPEKYKEHFENAVKNLDSINQWNKQNVQDNATSQYVQDNPYPVPTQPFSYPNILTAPDLQALGSSILHDLSPQQITNLDSLSLTDPAAYPESITDILNQLRQTIAKDVNVVNEPNVHVKSIASEPGWEHEAAAKLSAELSPDDNESLGVSYSGIEEKFDEFKKDTSWLDSFRQKMLALPIFNLFKKNPLNIQADNSKLCFTFPLAGTHCVDFADYVSFFDNLGSIMLSGCFFTCLAIIFL